jgi:hypothetical protein
MSFRVFPHIVDVASAHRVEMRDFGSGGAWKLAYDFSIDWARPVIS